MNDKNSLFNTIYPEGSSPRDMIEHVKREHADDRFCGCGTCKGAFEAAVRTANQTLDHQCGYWLYGYALALATVAKAYLMAHNFIVDDMPPDFAVMKAIDEFERTENTIHSAAFRHAESVHDAAEAYFNTKQ